MGEVLSKDTTGVMVGDRGSDFYALFDYKRDKNIEILARAKVDRHLHDDDLKLFERMAFGEPDGITLVNVPRSRKTEARSVEVEIRYKKVGIAAPGEKTKKTTEPIFLYAIEAREKNAKKDTQNPILWRLLTTIPVESITDAVEKVAWYAKRWLIERYHYVLKSGCGVEELQLETAPRIEKALAVYCIVAWQILFLTYEARNNPNISCENYFTRDEWISCYIYLRKKTIPEKAPTLKEFISIIAQLGGFLGRKGDGDPGVKVIWRGLKTLNIISRSIAASKGRNVYNG
jgi:hypothetical protein